MSALVESSLVSLKPAATIDLSHVAEMDMLRRGWYQVRKRLRDENFRDTGVHDPMEWLDFEILLDANLRRLKESIVGHRYDPETPSFIHKARGKGLSRPISIISIDDAVVLQAVTIAVAPLTKPARWSGAFDMIPTGNPDSPFEHWYEQWPEYQKKIRDNVAAGYGCLGVTDISSYFEYIDHSLLSEKLRALNGLGRDVAAFILYLLERWVYRPSYASNRLCGVPQLDHDGPRFLANFFLFEHDRRVGFICPEYVRWMDDMNLPAKSPSEVRLALAEVDQSLRDHYLSINRGKTRVLSTPAEIEEHFWFVENDFFARFEKVAKRRQITAASRTRLERFLTGRFNDFLKDWQARGGGNGEKILRRFITMFKRLDSEVPLQHIPALLVERPGLEDKLFQYLLNIAWRPQIYNILEGYLNSGDNIYQSVEISCLRLLLLHRIPPGPDADKVKQLGERYFFGRKGTTPLSWYAKVLGAFLVAKYGSKAELRKVFKHAGKVYDSFDQPLARRHLAYLSFLLQPKDHAILEFRQKSQRDPERLVQGLWHFESIITDSGTTAVPKPVKQKLSLRKIAYPVVNYFPWNRMPLLELLSRNDLLHPELKRRIQCLRRKNNDPIADKHLDVLEHLVS